MILFAVDLAKSAHCLIYSNFSPISNFECFDLKSLLDRWRFIKLLSISRFLSDFFITKLEKKCRFLNSVKWFITKLLMPERDSETNLFYL